MKNVSQIISYLTSKPQFKNISNRRCIMRVIKLLPPHLKNAVLFTYIKNQTLFIVLNHPGMKMEFNYKVNLIKDLLNKVKNIDLTCKDIEVTQIKLFVSNKKPKIEKDYIPLIYKERASGEFDIECKDSSLKEVFLKIQDAIKNSHDR